MEFFSAIDETSELRGTSSISEISFDADTQNKYDALMEDDKSISNKPEENFMLSSDEIADKYEKFFQQDDSSFLNDVIKKDENISEYTDDSKLLVAESQETPKRGGSYSEVRIEGEGDKYEVHHMPADSASPLERGDGPAIKMDKEDHRQTASCGMSREAREYRERQRELIEEGKFKEALQMDIDDIHERFGDKYDDAIDEMLKYVDKLEQEGKI